MDTWISGQLQNLMAGRAISIVWHYFLSTEGKRVRGGLVWSGPSPADSTKTANEGFPYISVLHNVVNRFDGAIRESPISRSRCSKLDRSWIASILKCSGTILRLVAGYKQSKVGTIGLAYFGVS